MPIDLHGVGFTYPDGSRAIGGVDLHVDDGERLAIVGQNGAGKTTTVKLMNRLLVPTEGEVLIDGAPTAKRTTAQVAREVGYVFQNPDDQLFAADVRSLMNADAVADPDELFAHVYAEPTPDLLRQREQLRAELSA